MNIKDLLTKRGKYYYFTIPTPKGTKKISTKCTTLEEAIQMVRESGLAELKYSGRSAQFIQKAVSFMVSGTNMTTRMAAEKYSGYLATVAAPIYRSDLDKTVAEFCQSVGDKPIAYVDEADVDKMINGRNATYATLKKRLSHLRVFMDYCFHNGWCQRQPARLVKVNHRLLTHEQKEKKAQTAYTEPEMRALVAAIQEKMLRCKASDDGMGQRDDMEFWSAAVFISFHTGLRLGDIINLQWSNFQEHDGVIVVHTSKTNKRVKPDCPKEVFQLITFLTHRSDVYLFPVQRAIYSDPKTAYEFPWQFKKLCESLGHPYYGFHSLRRGYITARAKAGETLEEIAKDVGHSSTETTQVYVR